MLSRVFGALMVVSALTSPTYVFADTIQANSKLSNVTVFPVGAQITRTLTVPVQEGEHVVVLKDLPLEALHDSIRVEGQSSGNLEIGSVDVKTIYVPDSANDSLNAEERKKLEEEIESLEDEKAKLEGKIKSIDVQQDFIRALSQLPARSPSPQADSTAGQPNWEQLYTLIGKNMQTLQNEVLYTQIAIRKLNKQIRELSEKLNSKPPRQKRRTQVQISVKADSKLSADLKVHYQVNRARWRPIYDARLKTNKDIKKTVLNITRRASITQTSGEEWKDITLKLSTTKPNRRTAVPKLNALLVGLKSKKKPAAKISRYKQYNDAAPEAMSNQVASRVRSPKTLMQYSSQPTRKANVRQAQAKISAFQAVYTVPGNVTISSTGEKKKLTISQLSMKPQLKAISVPKKQKVAFLSAKFVLPKGDQILAGRVNLHRDGVLIGKGYFPDLAAGAEHDLGFGADDAIQVKYAEVKRSKGEQGLLTSSKTDARKFKISIKNLHGWTVPMTILDQVPYTEDEQVKVTRLSETTKPSRENIDDKRGLLAWDFDLTSGTEKVITLGYQVSWPDGRDVYYRRK